MEEGVHQIFNTNYYTHLWGNILIVPFIVFFVLSLIITLARIFDKKRPFIRWHLYASFLLIPCALVAVYWDVYQTGQQATALCREKSGIHVYKTAEVKGFLGATDIEEYSKYGFSYLETRGVYGDKRRYTMQDGKAIRTDVAEFISDYEITSLKYDKKVTNRISMNKYYVTNRHTGEVLGEDVRIFIDTGWADSLFYNLAGFSYSPWICYGEGGERRYSDAIALATLKAKK
jgi:hypothetical protein